MSVKKPTYEEMEARLAEAEAARRSVYKKRNFSINSGNMIFMSTNWLNKPLKLQPSK
jgi:hypothetical protein